MKSRGERSWGGGAGGSKVKSNIKFIKSWSQIVSELMGDLGH